MYKGQPQQNGFEDRHFVAGGGELKLILYLKRFLHSELINE